MQDLDDTTLIGFIDDVELAGFYAAQHTMSPRVTEGLTELHDALVDLGPFVSSEQAVRTLTGVMGVVIDELKAHCVAGEEGAAVVKLGLAAQTVASARAALLA